MTRRQCGEGADAFLAGLDRRRWPNAEVADMTRTLAELRDPPLASTA